MVKAVIFDMDGTLIDTEKHLVACWCQAAQEAGFPFERKHGCMIRSLAGKYAEPLLKSIFGESFDYWRIRERRRELMRERLQQYGIEKKAGADELLDYLHQRHIKCAVATATDLERASSYLKEAGLLEAFDKIICASMVENGKPMPDIYWYACRQIKEKPEDCIAIEDSPNGVLSATRAGLRTILVPDQTEAEEELKDSLFGIAGTLRDVIPMLEEKAQT